MRPSEEQLGEVGLAAARHGGGRLEIEIVGSQECVKCGLCRLAEDGRMRVEVRDVSGIEIGQRVRVIFPYTSQWRSIAYVFALPLGLFFGAGVFGGLVASAVKVGAAGTALATAVSAGAGMAAGFMIARRADRAFHRNVFENTVVRPLRDDEA